MVQQAESYAGTVTVSLADCLPVDTGTRTYTAGQAEDPAASPLPAAKSETVQTVPAPAMTETPPCGRCSCLPVPQRWAV